jgi:monoamine oxidase
MSPARRTRSRLTLSPSTAAMRALFEASVEAERGRMPVEEVLGEAQAARIRRREFLRLGAGLGAVAIGGAVLRPARSDAAPGPRIAIVGAGLAGIRCADLLWHPRGHHPRLAATVYEADTTHVGGRCWTLRHHFSHGLIAEHGGAFINTDQDEIRALVRDLGLRLEVVDGGDLLEGEEIYSFGGTPYTVAEATADWLAVGRDAFREANRVAPWPQNRHRSTREGRRLDRLSVPAWLDEVGIGSHTRFGRLLMADVVSEYGGDPQDQSALNLTFLLGLGRRLNLISYDENLHVVGGNDQIVHRMIDRLPRGTVRQGQELVALAERSGGDYRLTFRVDGRHRDVIADHVVLALPFSTLREVDLSKANLTVRKLKAIREMGMGQNAKIAVELDRKTWPPLGYSGSAYTDWRGFCVAWDDSVPLGPHGAPAILLGFPGGRVGRDVLTGAAHGTAPDRDVRWFLDQIEPIYPGTKAAYTGRAYEDHWSSDPWHRGAYSFYRVGQYTTISGVEHVREGGIHFAGEHTEPNEQGFLNGAVVSGERVAAEILAAV